MGVRVCAERRNEQYLFKCDDFDACKQTTIEEVEEPQTTSEKNTPFACASVCVCEQADELFGSTDARVWFVLCEYASVCHRKTVCVCALCMRCVRRLEHFIRSLPERMCECFRSLFCVCSRSGNSNNNNCYPQRRRRRCRREVGKKTHRMKSCTLPACSVIVVASPLFVHVRAAHCRCIVCVPCVCACVCLSAAVLRRFYKFISFQLGYRFRFVCFAGDFYFFFFHSRSLSHSLYLASCRISTEFLDSMWQEKPITHADCFVIGCERERGSESVVHSFKSLSRKKT